MDLFLPRIPSPCVRPWNASQLGLSVCVGLIFSRIRWCLGQCFVLLSTRVPRQDWEGLLMQRMGELFIAWLEMKLIQSLLVKGSSLANRRNGSFYFHFIIYSLELTSGSNVLSPRPILSEHRQGLKCLCHINSFISCSFAKHQEYLLPHTCST